jgi:hypothetical protein
LSSLSVLSSASENGALLLVAALDVSIV